MGDQPPAAVTRRDPSGETWQLYTSKSFKSPVENENVSTLLLCVFTAVKLCKVDTEVNLPGWVNHSGFTRCIVAEVVAADEAY